MSSTHFDSYSDARTHFKDLLDAAFRGRPASVRRNRARAAVVDADRLRAALALSTPSRAQVVPEAGGWSILLPGLPIAGDGVTLDDAVDETIDALREYAADWQERLLDAPNHRKNWALIQLVSLSDDDQLRGWLVDGDQ